MNAHHGVLQTLGEEMKRRVPGLDASTERRYGRDHFLIKYKCPCGETARDGISVAKSATMNRDFVRYRASDMVARLRHHVREEGFEPSF